MEVQITNPSQPQTSNSLPVPPATQPRSSLTIQKFEVPGASWNEVEQTEKWRALPVRNMDAREYASAAKLVIDYVSTTYCGASEAGTLENTYRECAALFRQKFAGLCTEEIREAFRLAAANRIEANMVAYGGRFTVAMFGDILTAYSNHRAKIVAAIEAEKSASEAEKAEQAKRAAWQAQTELFVQEFEALKTENTKYRKWSDLPAGTDAILRNRGAFDNIPDKDKKFFWLESKRQAVVETRDLAKSGANIIWAIRIVKWCEGNPEDFPEELRPQAEVIYGKMLAFSLLAPFAEQPN